MRGRSQTYDIELVSLSFESRLGQEGALEAKDEANDDYILEPAGHHLPIA